MNWKALDSLNTTNLKAVVVIGLWVATFVVWAVCLVAQIPVNEKLFDSWLLALSALSGIGYFAKKNERETDYGALDRKAVIEAAKAGGPPNTNVAPGGVVVQQGQVPPTQVNADAGQGPINPPRVSGAHDPGA